jgi:hypothetical protein
MYCLIVLIVLHNEELHILCCSPSVIGMIKSMRMMRWAGHVARIGAKRNACKILLGKPEQKETDLCKDEDVCW